MSHDLKELAALTALNNMMGKGHFDICCVRDVGALLGVDPKAHPSFAILQTLHCVDYAKMPPQLRDAIPGLVQDCLGVSPTFQFTSVRPGAIVDLTPRQEKAPLLRLFGRKP